MSDITCGKCGRVSGHGAVGRSWICEDCRVEPSAENAQETGKPLTEADRNVRDVREEEKE